MAGKAIYLFKLYAWLLLAGFAILPAHARQAYEQQEGLLLRYTYGMDYAYDGMDILTSSRDTLKGSFPRSYANKIMSRFPAGTQIEVALRDQLNDEQDTSGIRLPTHVKQMLVKKRILWVAQLKGKNKVTIDYATLRTTNRQLQEVVWTNHKVERMVMESNALIAGLLLDNGWLLRGPFPMTTELPMSGQSISFSGIVVDSLPGDRYVSQYPVVMMREQLRQIEGRIMELLFDDDYICRGFILQQDQMALALRIDPRWGRQIRELREGREKVTAYYPLYAQGNGYYRLLALKDSTGSRLLTASDRKYPSAQREISISGKLNGFRYNPEGYITGLQMKDNIVVEVNQVMREQIAHLFTIGDQLEVNGLEQVMPQGYVRSRALTVIAPKAITINGIRYLLP